MQRNAVDKCSEYVWLPSKGLEINSGQYMSKLTTRMVTVCDAAIWVRGDYFEDLDVTPNAVHQLHVRPNSLLLLMQLLWKKIITSGPYSRTRAQRLPYSKTLFLGRAQKLSTFELHWLYTRWQYRKLATLCYNQWSYQSTCLLKCIWLLMVTYGFSWLLMVIHGYRLFE